MKIKFEKRLDDDIDIKWLNDEVKDTIYKVSDEKFLVKIENGSTQWLNQVPKHSAVTYLGPQHNC